MKKEKVDILEGNIPKDIMDALLRDHTTQRNIFWATKDYEQWGDGYAESDEITYEKVCDNNKIIPRVLKDRLQHTARSRDIAEDDAHAKPMKQIEQLEKKARAEKQPRKKLELFEKLKELKKRL